MVTVLYDGKVFKESAEGQTVSYLRSEKFGPGQVAIPANLHGYLNKSTSPIADDHVLSAGDTVEFK